MGYLSDQPTKLIRMAAAASGAVDHPVCGALAIGQNQGQSIHSFPLAAMCDLLPSSSGRQWQRFNRDYLLGIGEDAHARAYCEEMTTWS